MTDKPETERAAARTVAQLDRAPGKSAEAEDTGGHGFESHQSASAASNDELQPLNCDRDPARWAREFNDALQTIYPGISPPRLDEGWLIGWFANAMMCGEDTYRWRQESTQSATASSDVVRDGQRHALVEVICALQERVESLAVQLISAQKNTEQWRFKLRLACDAGMAAHRGDSEWNALNDLLRQSFDAARSSVEPVESRSEK